MAKIAEEMKPEGYSTRYQLLLSCPSGLSLSQVFLSSFPLLIEFSIRSHLFFLF